MMRSVFGRTLRTRLRSLIWWSVAAAGLTLWVLAFYPIMADNPELELLFAEMPPEMAAIVAGGVADMLSPEGFLNSQLFITMLPLMLLIYAIGFGTQELAGEEERGTIELVLSTPISRSRFVLEKFALMVVTTVVLGLAFLVVLLLGDVPFGFELGAGPLTAATVSGVLMAVAYGSLALAIGATTGRRALASGMSAGLAVAGYLLYTMAPLTDVLDGYERLSLFYYALAAEPLTAGLDAGHTMILVVVTVVLLGAAIVGFQRRDLAL